MKPPTAEWDFFIAHAGPDRAMAKELHATLEDRHGARCFSDVLNLRPGDRWPVRLKEALVGSRFTVVLVSANSEGARYLEEEVALAIDLHDKNPKAHRIVPVLLHGAQPEDLPYGLISVHRVEEDETGMAGVSHELATLLDEPEQQPDAETLVHLTRLLDELWKRLGPAYADDASRLHDQFRADYAIEQDAIVARSHGVEQQRLKRAEFEQKLTPDQLRHIRVLEKAMETNVALWERAYPNRSLDSKDQADADRALDAMGEDLELVLVTLEESGFWLDDHYGDVRRILKQQRQPRSRARSQ